MPNLNVPPQILSWIEEFKENQNNLRDLNERDAREIEANMKRHEQLLVVITDREEQIEQIEAHITAIQRANDVWLEYISRPAPAREIIDIRQHVLSASHSEVYRILLNSARPLKAAEIIKIAGPSEVLTERNIGPILSNLRDRDHLIALVDERERLWAPIQAVSAHGQSQNDNV